MMKRERDIRVKMTKVWRTTACDGTNNKRYRVRDGWGRGGERDTEQHKRERRRRERGERYRAVQEREGTRYIAVQEREGEREREGGKERMRTC